MPQPSPPHTFPRLFKFTLTTKRGGGTGTRRTAPVDWLTTGIRCNEVLPLDPTQQQEVFARGLSIDLQVFCDPADILAEDLITVSGNTQEYTVVEVARWPETIPRVLQLSLRRYQGG